MDTTELPEHLSGEEIDFNEIQKDIIHPDPRKALMLKALVKANGVITLAAQLACVSRQSHYLWLKSDDDYRDMADSIYEIAIDIAELKLLKHISEENLMAIMFMLRTRGKDRGYSFYKNPQAQRNAVFKIVAENEEARKAIERNRDNP